MRKILITISIFISFLGKAEICDTIKCNDIKDYISARITQSYIEFHLKENPNSKSEISKYKIFKKIFDNNSLKNPVKYDELNNTLTENQFKETASKITSKINSVNLSPSSNADKEIIADYILNSLLASLDLAAQDKIKKIPNLINDLKEELKNDLSEKLKKVDSTANINSTTQKPEIIGIDKGNAEEETLEISNTLLLVLVFISLVLNFVFFFVLNQRIKNNEKSSSNQIEFYKKELEVITKKSIGSSTKTEMNRSEFEKYLGNSEKFGDFYTKLAALESNLLNLNSEPTIVKSVSNETTNFSGSNNEEIFYMTKPVGNTFPVSSKSTSYNDTVYKFYISSNKNQAEYEVHTLGAPVKEIIKRSESYLIPGCDEENSSSESTQRIVTKIKGQVQLEDDKWIIKSKALIRYE